MAMLRCGGEPVTKSKCLLAAVFNAFLALRLVRFAAVNAPPPICGPLHGFAP
jgi:hypothetical protein